MVLFLLFSGVYHIYVDTDQEKNKLVGKYDNAGSFGELALMYNMPRAATIEAVSDGSLWAMVMLFVLFAASYLLKKSFSTIPEIL